MPNPFRKVLCPLDLGPNTKAVIYTARQMVEQNGAVLILFHVVALPVPAVGQPITIEPLGGSEHDAREQIAAIARESLGEKIRYEIEVRTGDPAAWIMQAAKDHQADLIVMATHGRKGLSHLILGSVAERVVRESPIPVLTVRASSQKAGYLSGSVIL